MGGTKRWYAVYTKPRWEKKVYRLLQEKGIESYCPLNKVRRKWSDRYKVVEEPLFKSYVFVRVTEDEKLSVRMLNGVVNFVYWLGKPAIVKDKEIEIIRLFLKEYTEIKLIPAEVQVNQRIRVKSGIFMDHEAEVISVKPNYVMVVLESLGYYLKARIQRTDLEPIKPRSRSKRSPE
jgi:transcription antitermination factor NusG